MKLPASKVAAKALADLLADKNVTLRSAAIQAIGEHKDPTIGPRLAKPRSTRRLISARQPSSAWPASAIASKFK